VCAGRRELFVKEGRECSLIPRSFPPPVCDRLQYGKTEQRGLGDVDTCDDIRWTEGRHTMGGAQS